MHPLLSTLLLLPICIPVAFADFLGPTYPAPKHLIRDTSQIAVAWKNVSSIIDAHLSGNSSDLTGPPDLKNLTFSLGMFSIHDPSVAESFQYHHTSAEVANSTTGVTDVDGTSIYRVASITKLVTTFAGMLELDERDWDRPITDFVPAFAAYARDKPGAEDPVNIVQWEKVTLAALASQLAGIPRDVAPFDPSDFFYVIPNPVELYGLPTLNQTDPTVLPPCANSPGFNCTADDLATVAQARPPTFLPWTSPQYTDFGFMLLAVAIANITNKSIHGVYRDSIFGPLNMTGSSSLPPPNNSTWRNYVVPGDVNNGVLNPEQVAEIIIPSGGIFSTTNDLAKLGTAILNYTLLSSERTREWMRSVTHTAHLQYAVGRTWEMYRYQHPGSGIITDLYTKSGDSGAYGGFIVLIPDFGVGFSVLGTSSLPQRSVVTLILPDIITETMLPALLAQAEAEANENFAGTYISTSADLNTTLTISLNNETEGATKPGLVLSSFISNGTDVLKAAPFAGGNPVRLLPSISDAALGQIAFRTSAAREPTKGLFQGLFGPAWDWVTADSGTYGGLAVGLFVFDVDEEGKATSVTPAAWRITLQKEV
ncbi:MAG: hypothetical protein Q9185_004782 [Variospora sp. 1 TL-2023]